MRIQIQPDSTDQDHCNVNQYSMQQNLNIQDAREKSEKSLSKSDDQSEISKLLSINQNQLLKPFTISKGVVSEDHAIYVKKTRTISENTLQLLKETLLLGDEGQERNSFKKHDIFENSLVVSILQEADESWKIELKLGFYSTILFILRTHMDTRLYDKAYIGEGKYGRVFTISMENFTNFTYEHSSPFLHSSQSICHHSFAIKEIKLPPAAKNPSIFTNELHKIFQQVFYLKFASSLKVGPKFCTLYGYDILLHSGSAQFVMEQCIVNNMLSIDFQNQILPFCPNISRQQNEVSQKNYFEHKLENDLRQNLSILHSFNLTHCDIKTQNIAFSKNYQKFVFLDFGLSKFRQEGAGFKQKTRFIGTYKFASPELKKLYFLKNSAFVDLYYNDLCGLEYSLANILKEFESSFINQIDENPFSEGREGLDWKSVVPLFQLRFGIFVKNYQAIKAIVERESKIMKTLQFITINQMSKATQNDNKFELNFFNSLNILLKQKISKASIREASEQSIDKVLSIYLYNFFMKSERKHAEDIEELLLQQQKEWFKQCWKFEEWKIYIFRYICESVGKDMAIKIKGKRKLVMMIHEELSGQKSREEDNYLLKFVVVLDYFMNYFCEVKNIEILKTISQIFLLLKANGNQRKTDECILGILLMKQMYSMYIDYLLQLFFAEASFETSVWSLRQLMDKCVIQPQLLENSRSKQYKNILKMLRSMITAFSELKSDFGADSSTQELEHQVRVLIAQIQTHFDFDFCKSLQFLRNFQNLIKSKAQFSSMTDSFCPSKQLRLYGKLATLQSAYGNKKQIKKIMRNHGVLCHVGSFWHIIYCSHQYDIEMTQKINKQMLADVKRRLEQQEIQAISSLLKQLQETCCDYLQIYIRFSKAYYYQIYDVKSIITNVQFYLERWPNFMSTLSDYVCQLPKCDSPEILSRNYDSFLFYRLCSSLLQFLKHFLTKRFVNFCGDIDDKDDQKLIQFRKTVHLNFSKLVGLLSSQYKTGLSLTILKQCEIILQIYSDDDMNSAQKSMISHFQTFFNAKYWCNSNQVLLNELVPFYSKSSLNSQKMQALICLAYERRCNLFLNKPAPFFYQFYRCVIEIMIIQLRQREAFGLIISLNAQSANHKLEFLSIYGIFVNECRLDILYEICCEICQKWSFQFVSEREQISVLLYQMYVKCIMRLTVQQKMRMIKLIVNQINCTCLIFHHNCKLFIIQQHRELMGPGSKRKQRINMKKEGRYGKNYSRWAKLVTYSLKSAQTLQIQKLKSKIKKFECESFINAKGN